MLRQIISLNDLSWRSFRILAFLRLEGRIPFFPHGRRSNTREVVVGSERDKATFYQKQLPIEQNSRPLENDRFWNAK